jgi:ABC-2 type transport system ATP-binding protein
MMKTTNAIEITGLRKEYRGFALKDVSFAVPQGYVMGLIGPNGAGKTTIIRLIMNLARRDGGTVRVFGQDNLAAEVAIKARIGFVYDEPCFPERASLRDIKEAIGPFYANWDERKFGALAGEFGLPMRRHFKKLSHGTKLKFALALALSHNADLLIMDEPTSGLDPVFRRALLKKVAALLQDERKTVLFSTHVTSDLERIADFITFIRDGEVVLSAAKDELLDNWGIVKAGEELLERVNGNQFRGVRRGAFGIEALTPDAGAARQQFGREAVVDPASLEDIMFFMTRGGSHA